MVVFLRHFRVEAFLHCRVDLCLLNCTVLQGRPVFTISSSLLLSNISMVSAAQGKV